MPRVLLVEDDPAVREGVEIGLRRRGHEVLAAATGEGPVWRHCPPFVPISCCST
ncbi:DNA-binding response OmpR family regulator [Streptomyces sp. TE33382]